MCFKFQLNPKFTRQLPTVASWDTSAETAASRAAAAAAAAPKVTDLQAQRRSILQGNLLEAPEEPSKLVRIFISSTFHDFQHERNYLLTNVYPELEDWCRSRGLEFQVVDLRWGIREDAHMDHAGVQMCLQEVRNCQKLSLGPNFVAFLGNRYGNRPVPSLIPESESVVLLGLASETQKALLEKWYVQDANAVPAEYILRSSRDHSSKSDAKSPVKKTSKSSMNQNGAGIEESSIEVQWQNEHEELLKTLRLLVNEANSLKLLSDEYATQKYFTSVTEQEIWDGLLKAKAPDKSSLCFVRKFSGNPQEASTENSPSPILSKFFDIHPGTNGEPDLESTELLNNLKTFLVPLKLEDRKNLFNFTVDFDKEEGLAPEKHLLHRQYLWELGERFKEAIKRLISDAIKDSFKIDTDDTIYKEVCSHAKFAVSNRELYCGHEQLLANVLQQVSSSFTNQQTEIGSEKESHDQNQPIIMHGVSGCGKTAAVAKFIEMASERLASSHYLIYRFLGTTPNCSSIDKLLHSLCQQIAELYAFEKPQPNDEYNRIRYLFQALLQRISKIKNSKCLLIVLDSLDQLSPAFGAFSLNWLPTSLPSNVQILVSTNTKLENVIAKLSARLRPESLVEMDVLSNMDGLVVLRRLLKQRKRTLQSKQWAAVRKVFKKSQNPLLLQLTLARVAKWRSSTPKADLKLGRDILTAISALLTPMEKQYGYVLVSHALSYIVASRNGITEREMEELLSLDDEVMQDVYQFWKPASDAAIGIPPLTWARLRQDISDFIVQREADETVVINFYQQQFSEVIGERYLSDAAVKTKIHSTLAEYFSGSWAENPKPITLKINGHDIRYENVKRMCKPQPLRFGTTPGQGRFNFRKLNELPHHLFHADQIDLLISAIVTDYEWMHAKIASCGLSAMLADIDMILNKGEAIASQRDTADLRTIRKTLRLCKATIEFKGNEDPPARELVSRLELIAQGSPLTARLIESIHQWYAAASERSCLEPVNQCFQSPNGCLMSTFIGHTVGITSLDMDTSKAIFASAAGDRTVRIWDLETDVVMHILELENIPVRVFLRSDVDKLLIVQHNGDCVLHSVQTGHCLQSFALTSLPSPEALVTTKAPPSGHKGSPGVYPVQVTASDHVYARVFCRTKPNLIACYNGNRLYVIDVESQACVKHFLCANKIRFISPSDTSLLVGLQPSTLALISGEDFTYKYSNYTEAGHVFRASMINNEQLVVLAINGNNKCILHLDAISDRKQLSKPLNVLSQSASFFDVYDSRFGVIGGQTMVSVCQIDSGVNHTGNVQLVHAMRCPYGVSAVRCTAGGNPSRKFPIILIGCQDEAMRVFDLKDLLDSSERSAEMPKFTLPGIWGSPTVLALKEAQILTASCNSPYIKLWSIASASSNTRRSGTVKLRRTASNSATSLVSSPSEKETPIHIASYRLRPTFVVTSKALPIPQSAASGKASKVSLKSAASQKPPANCKAEFLVCSIEATKEQLRFAATKGLVSIVPIPPDKKLGDNEQKLKLIQLVDSENLIIGRAGGRLSLLSIGGTSNSGNAFTELAKADIGGEIIKWSYSFGLRQLAIVTTKLELVLVDSQLKEPLTKHTLSAEICLLYHQQGGFLDFKCSDELMVLATDRHAFALFSFQHSKLGSQNIDASRDAPFLFVAVKANKVLTYAKDGRFQLREIEFSGKAKNQSSAQIICSFDVRKLDVNCIELSEDTRIIIVGTWRDKVIRLYSATDGSFLRQSYMYSPVAAMATIGPYAIIMTLLGQFSLNLIHCGSDLLNISTTANVAVENRKQTLLTFPGYKLPPHKNGAFSEACVIL